MADVEKAVKALKCCMPGKSGVGEPACEECPYSDTELGTCETHEPLFRDLLELLEDDGGAGAAATEEG